MSLYSSIDMFWFVQNNLIIRAANFVMSTKTFFCNVIVSTSFNVLHFYNGIVEFGLELKLSNDKRHWYQHSYLNLFFVLKRSFEIRNNLKVYWLRILYRMFLNDEAVTYSKKAWTLHFHHHTNGIMGNPDRSHIYCKVLKALSNVILVSFEDNGETYQGALINTTKR